VPQDVARAKYEVFFNEMDIFTHVTVFYLIVFILVVISWMITSKPWRASLRCAAFWTLFVLVIAHSFGMISRMYLQGRPPVTNLYASAVFIGWGVVVICLFLERVTKQGFGSIGAAVIGFITGIIAISLRGDGDTLEMQRAVLDTNFWLATHVTTVTLGYSATFLAGVLAIVFVVLGLFTDEMDKHSRKTLSGAIYATVCFAMLFSFIGTVLGGIWADQSWGRFWGWDPKENGALMIVIWNALILHARWGGLAKARGIAVLAIFGNIVTAWSWFGTNMLGAGLHAYGFIDSAVFWLLAFVVSQLVFIGLGLIPTEYWRSFAKENQLREGKEEKLDLALDAAGS
jgi:ABC-type transport system involved in cytochrome c biogenesis permease subunit